jgi:hypothetical protein
VKKMWDEEDRRVLGRSASCWEDGAGQRDGRGTRTDISAGAELLSGRRGVAVGKQSERSNSARTAATSQASLSVPTVATPGSDPLDYFK